MIARPTRLARPGTAVPLLAVCVVALFAFVALAIDLGMLMVARTECQNAADAAALAAARTLDNRVPPGLTPDQYDNQKGAAEANARTAVTSNVFLNTPFTDARVEEVTVGLYDYDTATNQFAADFTRTSKPSGKAWSAARVTVNGDQPTYFGRVLGISRMPMSARAVAVHRPRDIALVLDLTGSMGYGSTFTYAYTSSAPAYTAYVYNSPDPAYPQFGHYARYLAYQTTNPNTNPNDPTPANRPNPLRQTGTVVAAPYVYSPGNFTVTTANGPPIVRDFVFDPVNLNNPASPAVTVNAANLRNAFHADTFNAASRSLYGHGPTPAPDNFADQSDAPAAYVGDKWPRKRGYVPPAGTAASWDVTSTNGAAVNLAEYLGWCPRFAAGGGWPGNPPDRSGMASYPAKAYAPDWSDFRDATWEAYGYDLDVADYVANRPANHDPRTLLPENRTGGVAGQVKVTPGKFVGYSMGPGYWGKTFFVWPPDPRPDKDWRRRFFLRTDRTVFDPGNSAPAPAPGTYDAAVDADPASGTTMQTINEKLLTGGNGRTLLSPAGNYAVNYPAVLAWIKSGPPVLPPNLRSGRVLYYSSIPDDVNTAAGTPAEVADKRFWRAYIDFVLAGLPSGLAGVEGVGWPESSTGAIVPTRLTGELAGFYAPGMTQRDPRPYMGYTDNPARPRMHLWFGPITMLAFLSKRPLPDGGTIAALSGTAHQAQGWQLKAAVNSALDDVRANHPNDLVGLTYFSNADYNAVVVPAGQDWATLKNALFYPRSLLPALALGSPTAEVRPFDAAVNYTGRGDVPNAQGSTDPNTGLALAFNVLAPSSHASPDPARRGRRGAAKIVIFETDGVPNASQQFAFNRHGYESYYSFVGGTDPAGAQPAALAVIDQMVKPMPSTNASGTDGGLSLPSAPCRVYAIGFGDIFSTSAGPTAAAFLLDVQKRGGTSAATETAIPADQIITGPYQTRIDNLRTALERILQSGVQVTLIE